MKSHRRLMAALDALENPERERKNAERNAAFRAAAILGKQHKEVWVTLPPGQTCKKALCAA